MPVPDFSPGEVLTAAAMDSIGLWLVKTQTIGSAVSSVTVTGAFSSDYDNYLIQVAGGASSATAVLNLRLGSDVTGYRYQFIYGNWANSAIAEGTTTATSFQYMGSSNADGIFMNCAVLSPNLAKGTRVVSDSTATGSYSGTCTGYLPTVTQYTSFIILPSTGTLTAGTIRVYGYRK
jgi:hypothetical protein